jgi:hypothetical protein
MFVSYEGVWVISLCVDMHVHLSVKVRTYVVTAVSDSLEARCFRQVGAYDGEL